MTKDDLILGGFSIFQSDRFRFGTDAVLLYDLVRAPAGKTADLCSGNGAVALMLTAGGKTEDVTAVEIQTEEHLLCIKNAEYNRCEDKLHPLLGDVRKISEILSGAQFDTVCVNPPYFKKGSGILPENERLAISRHETLCDIDDILYAAAYLLKDDGDFYMVHRRSRQNEIIEKIQKYDLSIVEIRRVFSTPEKESQLFLIHCIKGRKNRRCKESTFTVQTADHTLSEEYKAIYYGR